MFIFFLIFIPPSSAGFFYPLILILLLILILSFLFSKPSQAPPSSPVPSFACTPRCASLHCGVPLQPGLFIHRRNHSSSGAETGTETVSVNGTVGARPRGRPLNIRNRNSVGEQLVCAQNGSGKLSESGGYSTLFEMFAFIGISNDEHDYTMKEFHDFINYDLMIT